MDRPRVILSASGYLWRCPECDTGNVVNNIRTSRVICSFCEAEWPVFEIRHRTHDYDIQPGKAVGALQTVRAEVDPLEADNAEGFVKEENGKFFQFQKNLIGHGGAVLVACGYTWLCPDCRAPNYARSPIEPSRDLVMSGHNQLTLKCELCQAQAEIAGVCHSIDRVRFGPPVLPENIYLPPPREQRQTAAS